jgi:hypothetical protein
MRSLGDDQPWPWTSQDAVHSLKERCFSEAFSGEKSKDNEASQLYIGL